jgi:hypothetical protein
MSVDDEVFKTIYNTHFEKENKFKHIRLEHPISKRVKICPIGFSWTAFFFGGFVPFFRGLNKLGFIITGILLLLWTIEIIINLVTSGVAVLVFIIIDCIIYVLLGEMMNKYCIESFLEEGYVPMDEASIEVVKYL